MIRHHHHCSKDPLHPMTLKINPRHFPSGEIFSINERLYMNFTETCPLFLLKEGIDHRFEFLDFAPDLYLRQRFHPINQNEFLSINPEIQTNNPIENIPHPH